MYKYDSIYWNNAKLIKTDMKVYADFGVSPWKDDDEKAKFQLEDVRCDDGMPMFATDFTVDSFSTAKLSFTALGCIDIYVNGKRVGNDELKPGWTNYQKRTLYYEYDCKWCKQNPSCGISGLVSGQNLGWLLRRAYACSNGLCDT